MSDGEGLRVSSSPTSLQGVCQLMQSDFTLGLWGFLSCAWEQQQGLPPRWQSSMSPVQLRPQ
eukprot:6478044-Amphidinium_carterae.1